MSTICYQEDATVIIKSLLMLTDIIYSIEFYDSTCVPSATSWTPLVVVPSSERWWPGLSLVYFNPNNLKGRFFIISINITHTPKEQQKWYIIITKTFNRIVLAWGIVNYGATLLSNSVTMCGIKMLSESFYISRWHILNLVRPIEWSCW